jgi:chemotaxis protein CheX
MASTIAANGAMKVEFINPFVCAGIQVLEGIIANQPEPGELAVRSAVFTTQQVSIVIGVTGAIEGQAVYGMSLVTATRIAAAMSGTLEMTFNEMAASAIAELGNMISGHATTLLSEAGHECDITPPTVIKGRDIELCMSAPALVVPIYSDCGKIEINVALKENESWQPDGGKAEANPAAGATPEAEAPPSEAAVPAAEVSGEAAAAGNEENQ